MAQCLGNRSDGLRCGSLKIKSNGYCYHHQSQATDPFAGGDAVEEFKENLDEPVENVSHETVVEPEIDQRKVAAARRRADSRAKRAKLGGYAGQKMLAERRKGYHRHWINDVGSNIEEMLARGYDFVLDSEASIDNDDLGTRKSLQVSKNGPPVTAFLMEIPEEFYLEDQAEKERSLQGVESQIRSADVGRGIGTQTDSDGNSVVYNPSEGKNHLLE